MVKIKICGLKRLEDIEFANKYKPDYVGFVFAESKRKVDHNLAKQMKAKLCEDIQSVGVFVDADISEILKLCSDGTIDIAQLHGMENKEYIKTLKEKTDYKLKIIKAIEVSENREVCEAHFCSKMRVNINIIDNIFSIKYNEAEQKKFRKEERKK